MGWARATAFSAEVLLARTTGTAGNALDVGPQVAAGTEVVMRSESIATSEAVVRREPTTGTASVSQRSAPGPSPMGLEAPPRRVTLATVGAFSKSLAAIEIVTPRGSTAESTAGIEGFVSRESIAATVVRVDRASVGTTEPSVSSGPS